MIVMKQEDLLDQAGMERAFTDYFHQVAETSAGTFNAMLDPQFVRCDFDGKTLVLRVETQPWMTNPGGILHGGIIASLLDFTMGLLCRYFAGGTMTPTVSMEVSYLRAAPVEGSVCVSAQVTKVGRTFLNTLGSLWSDGAEDRLLATSTGVYFAAR